MDLKLGELEMEKHVQYILSIEKKKDDVESVLMEHIRMNGAYWGLTALDLLGKLGAVSQDEVVSWIMKCQHESDISSLQNEDGSFSGDIWGEVDTRFSYLAICCLAILHRLDKINVEKAVDYIVSCKNLDGGFGCTPGGESHAGQRAVRALQGAVRALQGAVRALQGQSTRCKGSPWSRHHGLEQQRVSVAVCGLEQSARCKRSPRVAGAVCGLEQQRVAGAVRELHGQSVVETSWSGTAARCRGNQGREIRLKQVHPDLGILSKAMGIMNWASSATQISRQWGL